MKEVTLKELRQWNKERRAFTIVDARAADYFHWEHIQGALNLRWKDVKQHAKKMFPDKRAVLVTSCQSVLCGASMRAAKALSKLGYKNIFEFAGGISEWKAAALPVVSTRGCRVGQDAYRLSIVENKEIIRS